MRIVSRAESWETVYGAFEQINFSAFDYVTIKESIIDYLKLYFSEDFNDWIESSELLPIIEAFAYVGEILAYRFDLNAHENLITVAQRKESVLRLAKILSYNASRNIPARGLVKLTSISTTEPVFASNGSSLSNKIIRWNDPNNPNWKEQFIQVLNTVLDQNFGTVLPSDRVQVQDVVFELYELINDPINTNVIKYNINVSNTTYPMELVASELTSFGPQERRPEKGLRLSVIYLSDGLGDSSENTGFFFFTKQGELHRTTADFDGVTPNQTYDINVKHCNETDVWVNDIDPDTGYIVVGEGESRATERAGEWSPVDLASAQNIIFNTASDRNKYEIETLDDDRFRLIFGDGNFADIPAGRFEIWYRTSASNGVSIPINTIQNISTSFTYHDPDSKEQTFGFTVSLVNPIQNSAPSEDIDHIRRVAPAAYYTQDRMVNGRDYNEFMLQDNSILKLRSLNRTFSGDSKYIHWHDPREYYENVKLFGRDLVVYFNRKLYTFSVNGSELPSKNGLTDGDNVVNGNTMSALIDNYIESLLDTDIFFTTFTINGQHPENIRKEFTPSEYLDLKAALSIADQSSSKTIYMNYEIANDVWTVSPSSGGTWWISIEAQPDDNWSISYNGINIVMHSDETKFWITNDDDRVITTDTLNTKLDTITILSANTGATGDTLGYNTDYRVIRQMVMDSGEDVGIQSIHDLEVIPADVNNDGIPDNIDMNYLIGPGDYVYFKRNDPRSAWVHQPLNTVGSQFDDDQISGSNLWKRESGREGLNFLWMHRTPRYHLIDPASSNIIDTYIISRGYYTLVKQWLAGTMDMEPKAPTPFTLRSDYNYMLDNKMISDTVILHPGKIKVIIGPLAPDSLQATIKVIRAPNNNITANQLKTRIVDLVNEFFDINKWEFGETFYFTELSSYIHSNLPVDVDSVVLVPTFNLHVFGELYQVLAREDEIIQPHITVDQIKIIESISPSSLKYTI